MKLESDVRPGDLERKLVGRDAPERKELQEKGPSTLLMMRGIMMGRGGSCRQLTGVNLGCILKPVKERRILRS